MRCDQFHGLNSWAQDFVSSMTTKCTETVHRIYEDGTEEVLKPRELYICQIKTEQSGEYAHGMYGSEYPLFKHIFPDGRIYEEYVQAVIHSSGPMIFLALLDENEVPVPESLWDEDEIEGY